MKKDKDKQASNFNASSYDYLDNTSIDQWIYEFVKRSRSFQAAYSVLNDVWQHRRDYPYGAVDKLGMAMKNCFGIYPVIKEDRSAFNLSTNALSASFFVRISSGSVHGPVNLPSEPVNVDEGACSLVDYLALHDDKRLRLTLNLLYTDDEIISRLREVLHEKRKKMARRDSRKRNTVWKLYLMVWDVKTENPSLTYGVIGTLLSEAGVGGENGFEDKTIENYYHKAEELINGGYKKFLP